MQRLRWMLFLLAPLGAHAEDCRKVELTPHGDARAAIVDQVWSGTRVAFAGVEDGADVYMAYYDASRRLVVARYRRSDSQLCRQPLDSVFKGWDGHNALTLAIDGRGYLHVAGNMHASPLVYARSREPRSIATLQLMPMIGKDEGRTTYPTFVRTADGSLVFLYRRGHSGDGRWVVNRQAGDRWERVQDLLLADRWKGRPISAYPSAFVPGPDGWYHVAILWRRPPDATGNVAVSYARTRDFVHWQRHDGKPVDLPITPDTADSVDLPGENSGLSDPQVVVTASGQPIVVYTRFAADGRNAIVTARPQGQGWSLQEVAKADRRSEFKRLQDAPHFKAGLEADDVTVDVTFPGAEKKTVELAADTLRPLGAKRARRPAEARKLADLQAPPGVVQPEFAVVPVETVDQRPTSDSLQYFAQKNNKDQPRQCTPKQPKACDPPPSPLYFVDRP